MKLIRFDGGEENRLLTEAGMFDVSAFGEDYGENL